MVQRVAKKISELDELVSATAEMYVPVTMAGETYKTAVSNLMGSVFDVRAYGATVQDDSMSAAAAAAQATNNVLAIQAAIDLAEVAGGVVVFPGNSGTRYPIDGRLTVTASNVTLWAPGGAKLFLYAAVPMVIAVGDIESNVNTTQGNTLASNAAQGAMGITLAAGKGANFTAGETVVLLSDAVIPEHDVAVTNKVAEFVTVYSIAGDTLTLDRPLRYPYLTANTAQVYKVTWIENFTMLGLGIDGNAQTSMSIGLQLSWCASPIVQSVHALDIEQRLLRLQGVRHARVDDLRQYNGLSNGFNGVVNKFSYMLSEGGLNEGLIATNLHADRIRHPYTNGAGWTTNTAITSAISGIGAATGSIIGPGVHSNARGAGWDTHEVGVDIQFRSLLTLGSMGVGFQVRSVRSSIVDCFARDCIGAALQNGDDAIDTDVRNFRYENCNLGTDQASGTDWTKQSPIVDNSLRMYLGTASPNLVDNGGFDIWDRQTTFTASGSSANRWLFTIGTGASASVTRQSHTLGGSSNLPDMGRFFLRLNRTVTGSTVTTLAQYLSDADVRTLTGQRITITFDARASVDPSDIRVILRQHFGTGGSPSADVDTAVTRAISVNWTRYVVHIDVPSLSGKTVGSNEDSSNVLVFELPTAAGVTFVDLDRVKLEIGRTPTTYVPESTAATRARCSRWYETSYNDGQNPGSASSGGNVSICDSVANANTYRRTVHMTTRKGRVPTVTLYAPTTGTVNKVRNVTAGTDIAPSVSLSGYQSFHAGILNSGDVTGLDVVTFSWTAAVPSFE